jgi:hypothetical protein
MTHYNQWPPNSKIKYLFAGAERIHETYSQAWQDIFVLSVLNGRRNGTYLEIGCNVPDFTNNTYLLSKQFAWTGSSLDIIPEIRPLWNYVRPNDNLIITDALTYDYNELLRGKSTVDYLQVDIDPSFQSLKVLKSLPHDLCRFKVITFETDFYISGPDVRQESRRFLNELGYKLVAGDIIAQGFGPYEDWWVAPELVDLYVANSIKLSAEQTQDPMQLLLE